VSLLVGLVTLAALALGGHGVLALSGAERARGRLEWLVAAALAGTALALALALSAVAVLGPLPVWGGRLLLAAPALLGLALLGRRPPAARLPAPASGGFLEGGRTRRLAQVLLGSLALLVVVTAVGAPVHLFDATFHFAYKGKVLFHEGLSPAAFKDLDGHVGRVMTHPAYPPGLGLLHLLCSWVGGAFETRAGRGLMALFALGPAVLLHAALRSRGRGAALGAALLWLGLPILYYLRLPHHEEGRALVGLLLGPELGEGLLGGAGWRAADGPALDGGGDLPLAAFLCAAALQLGRICGLGAGAGEVASDRADRVLLGLSVAGMLLVKNEGLALLLVLVLAALLALALGGLLGRAGSRGSWRGFGCGLVALLAGVVLVLPWFHFQAGIPAVDESYPTRLTRANLEAAWSEPVENVPGYRLETRVDFIATEFGRSMVQPLTWNLLWPLFGLALGAALYKPRRAVAAGAVLPLCCVLGALALDFLILMVSPWQLGRLFATGIPDRLFLQVAPLAVLAVVLVVFAPAGEAAGEEQPPEPTTAP
jgi:hypothetical protein